MEIRTVFDLFQVIPAIFDLQVFFGSSFSLIKYFIILFLYFSNVPILFICFLTFFYDGEINTYIIHIYSFKRNDTSLKSISGESNAVTNEMTASQTEKTLPIINSKCKLNYIINTDEFGFFYQYLPNKTDHLLSQKSPEVKKTGLDALESTNQQHHDVANILKTFHVDTVNSRKVG